jgi:hypothetical protein
MAWASFCSLAGKFQQLKPSWKVCYENNCKSTIIFKTQLVFIRATELNFQLELVHFHICKSVTNSNNCSKNAILKIYYLGCGVGRVGSISNSSLKCFPQDFGMIVTPIPRQ